MAQTNVQAFSGDVDISSNLAVDTNKLFVDSVGNKVGIGTTNPGLPLEVLTGNGANYGLRLRRGSGAAFTDLGHLSTPGTEGLAFNVSDGISTTQEVMRITGTGNVGIGTDTPGAKMDIYTGSTSTVGLSFDRYASGNYRTDIYQNTYGLDFRLGYDANTPESVLYLKRLSNGNKEVEINGNVGIGTASPIGTLSTVRDTVVVNSTTYQRGMFYKDGKLQITPPDLYSGYPLDGDFLTTSRYLADGTTDYTGAALGVDFDGGTATSLYFKTSTDGTTLTERMRIMGNGRVGIGTDDPAQPLDVYTGTANFDGIQVRTGTDPVAFAKLITNPTAGGHNPIVQAGDLGIVFSPNNTASTDASPKGFYIAPWAGATSGLRINDNGNVGIGTNVVDFRLDLGDDSTQCRLGFGENIGIDNNRGVYWSQDGGYAIKRDSGAWTGPNYAQLRLQWATGIVMDAGNGTYGRSYVGVNDRMAIGSSYYNGNTKPPDNGLIVQGNTAIATNTDGGHTLNVNGRAFANHLQAPNYFYVYTNIGADGNWRTTFNIGTTAIGFFTVLSNNAGYGQPSAIWWYQYKSGGTTGYVSRISGSSTPTFRLSGQAVQSRGSGQQFVQVRTLPVSN